MKTAKTKRIAIYPGTFDPVTYGHLDVIGRAREIFDEVIVAIATNSSKEPLFTAAERVAMIREVTAKFSNVSVDSFKGLLVTYAKRQAATAIVRGLRAISDFEYEFQMALANRMLDDRITTVFLMPHEQYTYLNSSIVREIAMHGGDVSKFVPPGIRTRLVRKYSALKKRPL
jgi:pantetheine-phosphate adenylyltransferase